VKQGCPERATGFVGRPSLHLVRLSSSCNFDLCLDPTHNQRNTSHLEQDEADYNSSGLADSAAFDVETLSLSDYLPAASLQGFTEESI